MTIKVRVTHDQPGYDRPIVLEVRSAAQDEAVVSTQRIAPGESAVAYVWQGNYLVVREASS